jgi:uncharacterized protein (DUF58 family)
VSSGDSERVWRPTRALGRAVLLTGLLVLGGVLLGRVDLVLLATPFALGTAWALRHRPAADSSPVLALAGADAAVEGGEVAATASSENPGPAGLDVVVLRVAVSRWLALEAADRPHAVVVPPGRIADLTLAGTALRWGRHPFGPATATAFACDGLLFRHLAPAPGAGVKVYPATEPFEAAEAMPRAAGLVGTHRSRRPGEGGELAGVRRYAAGDRLRRVDWRVSLRTRQLHVAATLSDRDAELVLLLDLLAEAGSSGGIDGTASVLDTTVRAAAAIAEHYLQRGDRVSLVELGPEARRLRPASGRRQYLTVLEWLLDVRAGAPVGEEYAHVFGPHQLSPNALIMVLTPLVDARTPPVLARLARSGRYVVAVDTLPANHQVPRFAGDGDAAYRLWRLERDNTLGALREHGVPVVAWAGKGSLDQVLRDVARSASAPRVGVR